MTFALALGRSGSNTQWYLPGTDTSQLPSPPPGGDASPPVPGALEGTFALDGGGVSLLLDGLVSATGRPDAGGGLVLDVLGAWNSVKNASVLSGEAGRVTLSGFVHADVALGDGGDSSVLLHGAKRGNVLTGGGGDAVTVEAASNGFGWVSEFRVATGGGNDVVVVRPLDVAAAAAADATFAATANGAGAFAGTDEGTRTFVDLGAGDDAFLSLGRAADSVAGGGGDDLIRAGGGDDTLSGGAGDDLFLFRAGDGRDTILDFRPGADRLSLGLDPAGAAAVLDAAVEAGGSTVLSYGPGDSVTLVGVLKAQLAAADLL